MPSKFGFESEEEEYRRLEAAQEARLHKVEAERRAWRTVEQKIDPVVREVLADYLSSKSYVRSYISKQSEGRWLGVGTRVWKKRIVRKEPIYKWDGNIPRSISGYEDRAYIIDAQDAERFYVALEIGSQFGRNDNIPVLMFGASLQKHGKTVTEEMDFPVPLAAAILRETGLRREFIRG
ncbi:MAG TPA: hypothetical protein VJ183_03150 [Chloroflexia bacterium]|nr:hypothetical protein [Chloroflexia bacterium]